MRVCVFLLRLVEDLGGSRDPFGISIWDSRIDKVVNMIHLLLI